MRRVSGGYTIIEVMIFLAISLVIAATAMSLISGKQAQTDFNQKMRDAQSKLQDWINDTTTGFTGGNPDQQTCVPQLIAGTLRPVIENTPPTSSYSPNCTFLGKVIQITDSSFSGVPDQDSTLYAYPVFGCRLSGCNPNSPLPAYMSDANPEPATGQGSNPINLTETFDLKPAYVKSVSPSSHLIGFMNNFNTDNNALSNGSENLNVYLYSLNTNALPADQGGTNVVSCIEGAFGSPCQLGSNQNPPSLTSYKICLTDNSRYADITITSTSGVGDSVNLTYVDKTSC